MSGLLGAGLVLLALAAVAGYAVPWPRLGLARASARALPYVLGAAGSACLAGAGGAAIAGQPVALDVRGWLGSPLPGDQAMGLAADRLSGLFLLVALGVAVPVSVAFASWAQQHEASATRMLAAGYALALGGVAVVITGQDAFTVLFGWEALTAAFYLLAGGSRDQQDRAGAARVTVAFGKLSGSVLLIGLLLLAARAHSIDLAAFTRVAGDVRTAALVLLIAGFAVKAGLVPFQVWLPRGYAAAPGPARAIMAGTCVNVAFYGMWRTLELLGPPPGWLAGILLVLGGLTALLGIAHAAVQSRLSRVIAYSSVENSGLIITGFGIAATGAATGNRELVAVGLLAASLQMVMHAAAKALLFTAAAGLESSFGFAGSGSALRSAGSGSASAGLGQDVASMGDDLEALCGAGRRAGWSGLGLAVGSVTLAGLPPTAGFVSEWFILEALMQQFRVTALSGRLTLAVAGAAVALTAGFAGVTFVRIVGLVVLGPPDPSAGLPGSPGPASAGLPASPGPASAGPPGSPGAARARDYSWPGRIAVLVLAAFPLALAALTPLEVRVLAAGLSPVVPRTLIEGALKSPWVLQPVFSGFSILSPSWLWVELPLMLLAVAALALVLSGRRMLRVRRVPAWKSATIGVDGADSYTAFGYANPTRRVLASVLHSRSGVAPIEGASDGVPHVRYDSDVIEVVEAWLYRPAARALRRIVATAQRLQSGRLDAYLLYMLIALVAIIAVVTALD